MCIHRSCLGGTLTKDANGRPNYDGKHHLFQVFVATTPVGTDNTTPTATGRTSPTTTTSTPTSTIRPDISISLTVGQTSTASGVSSDTDDDDDDTDGIIYCSLWT